jgi:ubiquinone/menaquinone biosynthesis C-methylase UbiE
MHFKFPVPFGYQQEPIWTGKEFITGSEKVRVLKYSRCDLGWDARLTDFHEKEAGEGNHYIDRASRRHVCLELKKIKPNKNTVILEIGSSSGYLLDEIKTAFSESFLIGSDCIPEPLEKIAKKISNIPLIQFDLINCPLYDNSVDIVIALNVLEHIKDDETALKQIYRIMKPGGYAIVEVPANQDLYDFYDEQLKHFRRYSIQDTRRLSQKANFTILTASHLGFLLYPGFRYMKLRNKQKKMRSNLQKQTNIKDLIQLGGPVLNELLFFFMRIELYFGTVIQYQQGIRCLLLLKKERQ